MTADELFRLGQDVWCRGYATQIVGIETFGICRDLPKSATYEVLWITSDGRHVRTRVEPHEIEIRTTHEFGDVRPHPLTPSPERKPMRVPVCKSRSASLPTAPSSDSFEPPSKPATRAQSPDQPDPTTEALKAAYWHFDTFTPVNEREVERRSRLAVIAKINAAVKVGNVAGCLREIDDETE